MFVFMHAVQLLAEELVQLLQLVAHNKQVLVIWSP